MPRCRRCAAEVVDGETELRREVAGHVFVARVPARPCGACGWDGVTDASRRAFELRVAYELGRADHPEGFREMRRALGLPGAELAELLAVSVETISRWENARRRPPRTAMTLLSALVRDALEGSITTRELLRAFVDPRGARRRVVLRDDELD